VPAPAVVIPLIEGFCNVEEKPLGPLQLHELTPVPLPDKDNVFPAQTGLRVAPALTPEGGIHPPAQGCKAIQLLPSQNSKQPIVVLYISNEVAGLGMAFRWAVV
jgi:hypothetical protein